MRLKLKMMSMIVDDAKGVYRAYDPSPDPALVTSAMSLDLSVQRNKLSCSIARRSSRLPHPRTYLPR